MTAPQALRVLLELAGISAVVVALLRPIAAWIDRGQP